jgi:hypothetical protein
MHPERTPCLIPLFLVLASCGEGPRPIEQPQAPPPASFSGRAVLAGELAQAEGFLMISVRPEGVRMPLMTTKTPLPPAPGPGADRVVPIRLDSSNDALGMGLPPDAGSMKLELAVRFDADGFVETGEGDVTATVPVVPGQEGLEVVLRRP